jgi:hypothetical protein
LIRLSAKRLEKRKSFFELVEAVVDKSKNVRVYDPRVLADKALGMDTGPANP